MKNSGKHKKELFAQINYYNSYLSYTIYNDWDNKQKRASIEGVLKELKELYTGLFGDLIYYKIREITNGSKFHRSNIELQPIFATVTEAEIYANELLNEGHKSKYYYTTYEIHQYINDAWKGAKISVIER